MKASRTFALLACLVCTSAATIATAQSANRPNAECKSFAFAALGDTAYTPDAERELAELISGTLNHEDTRFVVHIGDFQAILAPSSISLTHCSAPPRPNCSALATSFLRSTNRSS